MTRAGSGKWSQAGVPHSGWSCINIEDLGEPSAICEMCEELEIRYVHVMIHPEHPELRCGCICAGHMESDISAAQARERQLKSLASRRARWLSRRWLRGRFISVSGFNIFIFRDQGGWRFRISRCADRKPLPGFTSRVSKALFPSDAAAKLASFDALIFMEKRAQ